MMNFDMPVAKKDDGPKINPDGTVEFIFATDEEKAALAEAKAAGIAKNRETGGSGRILSSKEKAGNWYGQDTGPEGSSEWVLDPEKPVAAVVETTVESLKGEDSLTRLTRQIDDIAKKRADILLQLVQATDEVEKNRLRALSDALEKGYATRMREYEDMTGVSQEVSDVEESDKLVA
ncbi:MAG: hypothetical protein KBD19_00955 [Candidatus Moranbacteria bacterium]|nr:hypothetical protein [Candidatus Moranbacteria bacterium]